MLLFQVYHEEVNAKPTETVTIRVRLALVVLMATALEMVQNKIVFVVKHVLKCSTKMYEKL